MIEPKQVNADHETSRDPSALRDSLKLCFVEAPLQELGRGSFENLGGSRGAAPGISSAS